MQYRNQHREQQSDGEFDPFCTSGRSAVEQNTISTKCSELFQLSREEQMCQRYPIDLGDCGVRV